MMLFRRLLAAWAVVSFVSAAQAQVVTVDRNKATLDWTWEEKGTDPGAAPGGFRMKCGNETLKYSKVVDIAGKTARSVPVKDAIGGTGTWFCAMSGYNKVGESGMSNEVNFFAGAAPSGSIVLNPPTDPK